MEILSRLHCCAAALVGILLHIAVVGCRARGSEMLRLEEHLFFNYRGIVRPVRDGISPTVVTLRMVLYALLDMDTRNQRFKIMTWQKLTWTDEFLTWNATEFGGIQNVHVKTGQVWLPDITLQETVDDAFERYKLDTYVQISPDGFATWYVPTIYTASCRMKVKYFPFDTQNCEMILTSWSYDGTQLDLQMEEVDQDAYLDFRGNGLWVLQSVVGQGLTTYYACCPEPYPKIRYTISFRRDPSSYTNYLLIPCVLLSALSLLVFYLPPDCGEKLSLSITNLLALVVFQQLVAETLPPSGDEPPILGTYFLIMIIMVCTSVVFTVIVIHVAFKRTPMPSWVETIIIKWRGRCVCITRSCSSGHETDDVHFTNPTTNMELSELEETDTRNTSKTETRNNGKMEIRNTGNDIPEIIRVDRVFNRRQRSLRNTQHTKDKHTLRSSISSQTDEETLEKWYTVSLIIDRMLLIGLTCFTVVVTVVIVTYVTVRNGVNLEGSVDND